MSTRSSPGTRFNSNDTTAVRTLALSMIRELKRQGFGLHHIVALAGELIGCACETIRSDRSPATAAEQACTVSMSLHKECI